MEFIVAPGILYLIYSLKESKKSQKKEAEKANSRDEEISEVKSMVKKLVEEQQQMKEINQAQSVVLDKHTDSIADVTKEVGELSTSMEVVKWANKEELAFLLEQIGADLLAEGYATPEQLRDFEKKFKIYAEGLHGNGVIEKLYHVVMELPATPPKRNNQRKRPTKKAESAE